MIGRPCENPGLGRNQSCWQEARNRPPREESFLTFSGFWWLLSFPGCGSLQSLPTLHMDLATSLHLVVFLPGHVLWRWGSSWLIHDEHIPRSLTQLHLQRAFPNKLTRIGSRYRVFWKNHHHSTQYRAHPDSLGWSPHLSRSLIWLHLLRPHFQGRSHSQVIGIRHGHGSGGHCRPLSHHSGGVLWSWNQSVYLCEVLAVRKWPGSID